MRADEFDYTLPEELIAQTPVEPRDHSRLLVVHRAAGRIEHRRFYELGDYLREGDLLVANESRVLPARLLGRKVPTGGKVEVLLLRPLPEASTEYRVLSAEYDADAYLRSSLGTRYSALGTGDCVWEALVSPGRRVHDGTRLGFGDPGGVYLEAEVMSRTAMGGRVLRFDKPPRPLLDQLGQMPLPPYIHETLAEPERYQTVYARTEGSAAAPTAGLHFTQRLIGELSNRGVGFATVTLHVGLDTFRPLHEERLEDHAMHKEWFVLPQEAADTITRVRARGGRVVAVGTTSVRVLETVAQSQVITAEDRAQEVRAEGGWTGLYITPGYKFGLVDAIITNFHLPRTTLIVLVSAFAGRDLIMRAYDEAVRERYRFYSFGDAMLIL